MKTFKTCTTNRLETQIGRNKHNYYLKIYLNQCNKNEDWCEGVTDHHPDPPSGS